MTEASAKVASQAVEAAIVESESRFNLNSRALLQLADAGVSPNVIDLMVAQSFPSHFRVERPVSAPLAPVATAMPPTTGMPGAQYPYPYGTYDPYDYYGYYYSPFAYPYYWGNSSYYNNPRYFISNGNSTVFVNGGTIIGGGSATPSSSSGARGQVVNGQGYTRVHTGSEPDATAVDPNSHPTTTTPRTVRSTTDSSTSSPSTSTPSTSSSSGSTDSSSSSGGAGVSNQGYSNGGGGDTGRTAQPR